MSDTSSPTAFGGAPRPPRFQPSVHQIPTPGIEERPKRYVRTIANVIFILAGKPLPLQEPFVLNFWVVSGVSLLMIFMAIGLQIALHISRTLHGFGISTQNRSTLEAIDFVTSFFLTSLVAPLALFWTAADWMLRLYQPYVTLSEGNAPASRSIMLDYISLDQLAVIYYSVKHKHYLINLSTLTALSVVFLQPLAGALLSLQQVPHTSDYSALSTRTLALSPDISQLNAFLASAGEN
ncbi:hypothetical protein PAXRUDRAFT_21143 [Paxillus rubicundulus Ve08.2h10]|uniref:Uncharacterized protein n=1 Tax=Paxillus rubicundulus Ve08.2h10 TaxID=930991 RepID=A0A0D0D7Z5_9AGAM|nr:hypothetical protein PAXRUDRAFT_21143 [Paxillus rubicundulus Ve08.2h10]